MAVHPHEQMALGDVAARQLANATKTVPMMSTITPRWRWPDHPACRCSTIGRRRGKSEQANGSWQMTDLGKDGWR